LTLSVDSGTLLLGDVSLLAQVVETALNQF